MQGLISALVLLACLLIDFVQELLGCFVTQCIAGSIVPGFGTLVLHGAKELLTQLTVCSIGVECLVIGKSILPLVIGDLFDDVFAYIVPLL